MRTANTLLIIFLIPLICFAQTAVKTPAQVMQEQYSQAQTLYQNHSYAEAAAIMEKLSADPQITSLPDWKYHVYDMACFQALAGKPQQALATLKGAFDNGVSFQIDWIQKDPDLTSLHGDPQFQQLISALTKKMALWTDNPTIASPYKSDLSEDEKVAGLSKFWSEARFNFPFFDRVPGLDWDRLYMEYLPQVRAAQTTAEYYRVLMRFAAALHDGHTEVHPPDELREVFYSSVPLETALVEDKVLITTVYDPALEAEGAQVGTQIVSINEQPVREYAEHFVAAYASGSTSQDRETRTYGYMLLQGPKSEAVRLVVQDVAGEKKSISAHRYCEPTSKCQWSGHEPVEFKILPEGIAYLAVREFVDDHCPKMMVDNFAAISQAKALIVDVRRNYGGNQMNAMAILRMLTDKSFDNVTVRELNYLPGERAQGYAPGWKKYPAFEERPDPDHHFSKPVVVLADQTSFSAAENFVVVFDSMHRGAIVGSTTPGSTGDSVIFKLPGGGNARIMMADVEYPDGRLFEGIGVTPHVKVSPTVSDIRQGRDEVLERAIEILQSGRATQ